MKGKPRYFHDSLISCNKEILLSVASLSFPSSFLLTERYVVSFIVVATNYSCMPFLIAATSNRHKFLVTNEFEFHSLFSFQESKLNVRFEFSNKTTFNVKE